MFDFTLAFYKEVRMMKEAFWTVILQKGTSYVVVTFYLLFIGEMLNYTEQDTSLTHPLLSDAYIQYVLPWFPFLHKYGLCKQKDCFCCNQQIDLIVIVDILKALLNIFLALCLCAAFEDMLENPLNSTQWMNDPETGPVMLQISRIFQTLNRT